MQMRQAMFCHKLRLASKINSSERVIYYISNSVGKTFIYRKNVSNIMADDIINPYVFSNLNILL